MVDGWTLARVVREAMVSLLVIFSRNAKMVSPGPNVVKGRRKVAEVDLVPPWDLGRTVCWRL